LAAGITIPIRITVRAIASFREGRGMLIVFGRFCGGAEIAAV